MTLQHLDADLAHIMSDIGVPVSFPALDINIQGRLIENAEQAPAQGYPNTLSERFHELTLLSAEIDAALIKRSMQVIVNEKSYIVYKEPLLNGGNMMQVLIQ